MIDGTNKYSPSEMLTLYMDGELDSSLLPAFEKELSKNSDLQTEYRELLAIREAVQKDVKKLVPPYQTTSALFESLGISYTSSIATSSTAGMTAWQQILMPLVASFSAAIVTLGTVIGVELFNNNTKETSAKIAYENIVKSESTEDNQIINNQTNDNLINDNQPVASKDNLQSKLIQDNLSESKSANNKIKSNLKNQSNNIITKLDSKSNSVKIVDNQLDKEISNKTVITESNNNSNNISNEIIEFFELYPVNVLTQKISSFRNGLGSKFGYSYNNQILEKLPFTLNQYSFGVGYAQNQSGRLIFEINTDKYKFSNYAFNSIGLNLSNNLFGNNFVWNPNLALEFKRDFKTLFNGFAPQIFAGVGQDFNSSSQFLRGGLGAGIYLPSNLILELRGEYNSLLNIDNIQLQDLNYLNNNRLLFIVNIKYNF